MKRGKITLADLETMTGSELEYALIWEEYEDSSKDTESFQTLACDLLHYYWKCSPDDASWRVLEELVSERDLQGSELIEIIARAEMKTALRFYAK